MTKRRTTPDGKEYVELNPRSRRVPKDIIKNKRKGVEKPQKHEEKEVTRSWWRRMFGGDEYDDALDRAHNEKPPDLDQELKSSGWDGSAGNMWS